MVSPIKLAHVVLFTGRLAQMRDWYLTVLNARVVHENSSVVFITYDEEHHGSSLLIQAQWSRDPKAWISWSRRATGPRPPPKSHPGIAVLSHIAFTYESLGALPDHFVQLEKHQIRPVLAINHGTAASLYYVEPDGNNIELQVDNFETAEEGTAYMMSEAFEKNPVGVSIDPHNLIARLHAGETESALLKPWW